MEKQKRTYKRLTAEQLELLFKLSKENVGLRAIARTLGVALRTVQYQIQKQKKQQEEEVKN